MSIDSFNQRFRTRSPIRGDGLGRGADHVPIPDDFAVCFAAASSSYFGPEEGLDAVSALLTTAPLVSEVIARFVVGPSEIDEALRNFITGWCVGYLEVESPPGVTAGAIHAAVYHHRIEMDERGKRMLREAIELGLVSQDLRAVRWFREGWRAAISHWHGCFVRANQEH